MIAVAPSCDASTAPRPSTEAIGASAEEVTTVAPLRIFATPDEQEWLYRFSLPTYIRASALTCQIVVADAADRAAHFFSFAGEYIQSRYLGGRDEPILGSITAMDMTDHGEVLVADGRRWRVATIRADGSLSVIHLDSTGGNSFGAARVAWGPFGSIVYRPAGPYGGVGVDGIFRRSDENGRMAAAFGVGQETAEDAAGAEAALDGLFATHRDTIWYARTLHGVVEAYIPGALEPVLVLTPEIDLSDPAPSEAQVSFGAPALLDFDIDEAGIFYFVMNGANGKKFLALWDRRGGYARILLNGTPKAVTGAAGWVFALETQLSAPGVSTVRVVRIRNPLRSSHGTCTKDQ